MNGKSKTLVINVVTDNDVQHFLKIQKLGWNDPDYTLNHILGGHLHLLTGMITI